MPLSEQLRDLVKHALNRRETVYFTAQAVPITFETEIKDFTTGSLVIKNAVSPALISEVMAASSYALQVATLRFTADRLESDGKHMIFPITPGISELDGRKEQRVAFTAQESAVCEILNPYDLQTTLKRQVIDLSGSGLSLRSDFHSKLLAPGTPLPSLKLFVKGNLRFERSGRVVYTRQLMNLKGRTTFQTGIHFG